ncbi:hypothetical protein FEF34_08230 [Streptomyces marianii]|uniref:Uncharacterized protein n=1 Tax=Streptomyces marianii TaxID=1817406 RepID=A0A5R9E296_9ACTN|nr:hypothetical protein FEF34_08230 [Streptomyces marianii]
MDCDICTDHQKALMPHRDAPLTETGRLRLARTADALDRRPEPRSPRRGRSTEGLLAQDTSWAWSVSPVPAAPPVALRAVRAHGARGTTPAEPRSCSGCSPSPSSCSC